MICCPLLSNIARHLDHQIRQLLRDMTSGHRLGSLSSPPYPTPSLFLQIDGPTPESLLEPLTQPLLLPQQLPQQVLVDEADPEDLDRTYAYVLEGDDPEIASNAIVLVDATTQCTMGQKGDYRLMARFLNKFEVVLVPRCPSSLRSIVSGLT